MKLPSGTPGIHVVDEAGRRCSNCYNMMPQGDTALNPHPGVWLCTDCWPDEVKELHDRRKPVFCSSCNMYHAPNQTECW